MTESQSCNNHLPFINDRPKLSVQNNNWFFVTLLLRRHSARCTYLENDLLHNESDIQLLINKVVHNIIKMVRDSERGDILIGARSGWWRA